MRETQHHNPRERVVVSAPMSFSGSAQRIWKITYTRHWWTRPLPALLAVALITVAWAAVLCWYVVVFGLFGLFAIPFRLIRRGQRQRERQAARLQRQLIEAVHLQPGAEPGANPEGQSSPIATVSPSNSA
jgi:Flp pilus assembly protein TadB